MSDVQENIEYFSANSTEIPVKKTFKVLKYVF